MDTRHASIFCNILLILIFYGLLKYANDSTVAIMDVKTASSERLKNEINRSLQELGDQATTVVRQRP